MSPTHLLGVHKTRMGTRRQDAQQLGVSRILLDLQHLQKFGIPSVATKCLSIAYPLEVRLIIWRYAATGLRLFLE